MQPIASLRHTLIVLSIFAVFAISSYSSNMHREPGVEPNRVALYLGALIAQAAIVYYVRIGLRGVTLRELIGMRPGVVAIAVDIILGFALWFAWRYAGDFVDHLLGGVDNHTSGLTPRGALESSLWIAISIAAGLGEEIVFRGYLQRQFTALTGSAAAGIVIQAVVFGASHGYQGLKSMVLIAIYGLLFGLLAWWRRSLVPGMIAHAWTDIVGGLLSI